MTDAIWPPVAAFWLGILTSISPCLLATNVTAISFLARKVTDLRFVLLSCVFYIAGQAISFVLLASLLVESLLSMTDASFWLQKYMFRLLGPLMVVCAMFLLELWNVQIGSGKLKGWANRHAQSGGYWVAALLGVVFGMSFCPTTAALFFGSLIPLAIARESSVLLPVLYAVGVAFPVIAISLIVAFAAQRLARFYSGIGALDRWGRKATGTAFLVVGFYFTIAYTLELI
ncbi:MAG: cytochrome c biogenesis protein [Candidatus Hydrogenedentota bacterium]